MNEIKSLSLEELKTACERIERFLSQFDMKRETEA